MMMQIPRCFKWIPHQITGRPRITWLNTIQRNLAADKLTLNEAVDLAKKPSSAEADVYVWRYALLVVLARKEDCCWNYEQRRLCS